MRHKHLTVSEVVWTLCAWSKIYFSHGVWDGSHFKNMQSLTWLCCKMSCCLWSHGLQPKKSWLVWQCHQIPLLWALYLKCHDSHICLLLIKVIMRWYWGLVHRSPDIYLIAEERLMKAVRPAIASNGISYIQLRSIGSHCTSGREKEGNQEKVGTLRFISSVRSGCWTCFVHLALHLSPQGKV